MIKYFTIYGERCSGTNFLEHAIKENFKIEYVNNFGPKHFFGFHEFNNKEFEDETLFICIVRNPISWIDSFYKKPHHIPNENKDNIVNFITKPFYSIYDNTGIIIEEDKNMLTEPPYKIYKNIFEMRYIKNNYLISTLSTKVKNHILIRYEDLLNYYETVLIFLESKFDLNRIYVNQPFKKIENYKGCRNFKFEQKSLSISRKIIKYIKLNLIEIQEKNLGYLI